MGLGVVLLGLLATAAALRPNARGYGTHQQLGLPPCTFHLVVGLRCPACGMTTAWANLVRGRLLEAARANAGGLALGIVAMGVGPWALVSGLRGKWLGGRPRESLVWAMVMGAMVVTLLDWGIRIFLAS